MVNHEGVIRAYQSVLKGWAFTAHSFSEDFAIKRFQKKFQEPVAGQEKALASKCFEDYIEFDNTLPSSFSKPLSGEWYKARLEIHNLCRTFRKRHDIEFPKGSSLTPTFGRNSVQQRLEHGSWDCTPENFDEFSRLVYSHKALKRAFRKRYYHWYRSKGFDNFRESERRLWDHFRNEVDPGYKIFRWKLERVTRIVRGSRFSTVPKDNTRQRPINIEPFCNILTQRQIGNGFRDLLRNCYSIDLDTLQYLHRDRIRDSHVATIDLKNASDSMSVALVEFLFPKHICRLLHNSRSDMLYGLDGNYHVPRKISSMGNGFTFELMTTVLTVICRVLDINATVFGDDIIINKEQAPRLIELLEEVGFVVNKDKSFIDGPFRESCGANYHEREGYIESFDFLWPTTLADCALVLTKCYHLRKYPSFSALYDQLLKRTPKALRGAPIQKEWDSKPWETADLIVTFPCEKLPGPSSKDDRLVSRCLQYEDLSVGIHMEWLPKTATRTARDMKSSDWAKYEMYLAAGRLTPDVITGRGRWVFRKHYFIGGRKVTIPKSLIRSWKEMK